MIELHFNEKRIIKQWNEYLDHLLQAVNKEEKDYSAKLKAWSDKVDDLLADLLLKMSESLGYDFDKVKIKRGIYVPIGHSEDQRENAVIRRGLVNILTKKYGFPVEILQPMTKDKSKE